MGGYCRIFRSRWWFWECLVGCTVEINTNVLRSFHVLKVIEIVSVETPAFRHGEETQPQTHYNLQAKSDRMEE